jgi:hypothetical protein
VIAIMLIGGLTLLVAIGLGARTAPPEGALTANPVDMLSIGNKPCAEDHA